MGGSGDDAGPLTGHGRRAAGRPAALAACAALGGGAAALILLSLPRWAGLAVLAGVLCLGMGTGWRNLRRPAGSGRTGLLADLVDPVFTATVTAALAWSLRHSDAVASILALAGMGLALVASYERARGQALGYRGLESVPYRLSRGLAVAGGLLAGALEPALLCLVVLTGAAAVARALNVVAQENRRLPGRRWVRRRAGA